MTVKTTGAEFKRFYADTTFWPKDAWHEDETVFVNDEDWSDDHDYNLIPDAAVVKVTGGIVLGLPRNQDEPSLGTYFKRWSKAQTTESFVVECHKNLADAVKAVIKATGGKVV